MKHPRPVERTKDDVYWSCKFQPPWARSCFCNFHLRRGKKSYAMHVSSHFRVMNNVVLRQAFFMVLLGSRLLGRREGDILGPQPAPRSVKTCKHLWPMCVWERTWRQQSGVLSYDTIRGWQWCLRPWWLRFELWSGNRIQFLVSHRIILDGTDILRGTVRNWGFIDVEILDILFILQISIKIYDHYIVDKILGTVT